MTDRMQFNNSKLAAFGEIMMRLHCPNGKRLTDPGNFEVLFGGAEANVCVFLSGLGLPARLVTGLPENDLATAAADRLRSHGVDISCIVFTEGRMGLYFTENGNLLRPSKVIYDRKNSAFSSLKKGMIDWQNVLKGFGWFHWSGITPALSANSAEVCLEAVLAAKQMGITVSVDLNYRSSLWDYGRHPSAVMPEFLPYCDVVTGDLHATSIYFGIGVKKENSPEEQFRSCAQALKTRFGSIRTIAFSFRNHDEQHRETYRGSMVFENDFYFSPNHMLPMIIDRIGSGDAFTAGLIYSLSKGFAPQDTVGFATACGILKHSIHGDFARISEREVHQFIELGPGNRVNR